MPERLDFSDRDAVRTWIADLRVAFDDAAGVTEGTSAEAIAARHVTRCSSPLRRAFEAG